MWFARSYQNRTVTAKELKETSASRNLGRVKPAGTITVLHLLIVAGLIVLPVMALRSHSVDYRWATAYLAVISALTFWSYARDKRKAQEGSWRISEAQLHLLELLGGWPAAFVAQRRFRHKCSKPSYQAAFWLIVLAYQFAAYDSLQDWKYSRSLLKRGNPRSEDHVPESATSTWDRHRFLWNNKPTPDASSCKPKRHRSVATSTTPLRFRSWT